MKKIIILFGVILMLLLVRNCFSAEEEIEYYNMTGYIYNDFKEELHEVAIRLTYKSGKILMYCDHFISTVAFEFKKADLILLQRHIKKYKEWNRLAIEKKMKLEKPIGKIKIKKIYFKRYNTWYKASSEILTEIRLLSKLQFLFFSQSEERHQFIIRYPERLRADSNKYTSITPKDIYLDYKQVFELQVATKYKNVMRRVNELVKEKKDVSAAFK